MDQINLRIRELRRAKKWSQKQLADAMHSTQQSVTDWETGKKVPMLEAAIAACEAFGVSLDYLVGRTDVPYVVQSSTVENGEIICFTTKKDLPAVAERPELSVADVTLDEEALPTSRKELEQLVESLLRKALSGKS